MTVAWRIIKKKHAGQAFSGEGARLYGGRWNPRGTAVVYVADSLALAALEQFIHLGREGLHIEFVYFQVDIPDSVKISEIAPKSLPKQWRRQPPTDATMGIGQNWAQGQASAVLKAPSAIVPHGFNFLLNPNHPDFANLIIADPQPFSFDPRMWKD